VTLFHEQPPLQHDVFGDFRAGCRGLVVVNQHDGWRNDISGVHRATVPL